jgi:hypothetical protein
MLDSTGAEVRPEAVAALAPQTWRQKRPASFVGAIGFTERNFVSDDWACADAGFSLAGTSV